MIHGTEVWLLSCCTTDRPVAFLTSYHTPIANSPPGKKQATGGAMPHSTHVTWTEHPLRVWRFAFGDS